MPSKFGSIVRALMKMNGLEGQALSFKPDHDNTAQALNSVFLITLAGASHPAFEGARGYLEKNATSSEWGEVAKFYLDGEPLVRREIESAYQDDPDFAGNFDRLSEWITHEQNLSDVMTTAEKFWAVFFPEANGLISHREERLEALRSKRKIAVTRLNPSPLTAPARELLFASNVLLTLPLETAPLDELPLSDESKERLSRAFREPQLFWYDHPIPVGVEPAKNEFIHGLKGLEMALAFERRRGLISPGSRPVCILSVSVTHEGLRELARGYIEEELARSGGLEMMDLYAFTEADTQRIISKILGPAGAHYLRRQDAERLLGVFGVDGEYGRHYSFLKAVAAFWQVFIDPRIKATFKIDLDQVFPQKELVAETGCSAFEHFQTPLWGAHGLDGRGRPVELGMIAGALVNEKDIGRSLFSCDVPFPDHDPSFDELIFFTVLPQALSTEAEMMARYDRDDLDGEKACLQRIHVTGGTNGILVDSLRRRHPFTPSFIGRAEDQAYLLSALKNPGPKLAYLHKAGLIMRHDKEAFAREAMGSAFVGKLIGDYVRIIYFSAYAKVLTGDIRELKNLIDPFTGCFVSIIPGAVVYLRFAFKAASFFASDKDLQGVQFIREGARRLRKALEFASGKEKMLERTYFQERAGWDLFYEILSAVEDALAKKDGFAMSLQQRARAIVKDCAIFSGKE
ncbi:MAG: hypothetical protein WBC70_12105 [Candidatus Aminicenantales bacterium]